MVSFLLFFLVFIVSSEQPPKYGPWGQGGCTHKSVYIGGYITGGSQEAFSISHGVDVSNQSNCQQNKIAISHFCTWCDCRSYGYIILGPKSCPSVYCQKWWEDVQHTITTAKEKQGKIDPALNYADFSKIGLYGHSMGGAAVVHVSDNGPSLGVVASVALHPAVVDDNDKQESSDVKIPMLWFTGSKDDIVPAPGVWKGFDADKYEPKICAELKGATHFNPCDVGDNTEDAYVAQYFDCWIRGYESACAYFYGNHPDNLCKGGPEMTKCQIVGNKTSIKTQ